MTTEQAVAWARRRAAYLEVSQPMSGEWHELKTLADLLAAKDAECRASRLWDAGSSGDLAWRRDDLRAARERCDRLEENKQ